MLMYKNYFQQKTFPTFFLKCGRVYLNSFVLFLKTLAKRTSHVIGWFQPELTNQIVKAIVALEFTFTRGLADYIILRHIALYETTFSFLSFSLFFVAVFILPLFVYTCAITLPTVFLLVLFFSFYLYFKLQFRRGETFV